MRSATALAVAVPFGMNDPWEEQMPLPIPRIRPVLPAPTEDGPQPAVPLRERTSRFLQAIAEVLAGDRPARQLAGWLAPDVFRALERHTAAIHAHPPAGAERRHGNPRIVSVHIHMVDPKIAEISGRFIHGERSRALAARLEVTYDHRDQPLWQCTALEWA